MRNKTTKIALALGMLLLASQAQADQLADIKAAGVVKVATFDANPPFGSVDAKTHHIVGYDVDTLLRLLPPIVTSIDQPLEQMTDAAVETLLHMMRDDSPAPASVTLDVALHAGQTA